MSRYTIIGDYNAIRESREAVDDYRCQEGIADEITWIDWTGCFGVAAYEPACREHNANPTPLAVLEITPVRKGDFIE